MKKLTLTIMAAVAMAFASCGDAHNAAAPSAAEQAPAEAYETTINIRYVSMDSILANYKFSQIITEEARKTANELMTYQNQLQNQLQNQQNAIQQKLQNNGYLSEASYNEDMKQLQNRANSLQNQYAQREMKANQEIALKQQALMDSINNFIEAYNKDRRYDAILLRDAGLYFNPSLDITDEVLAGLNARYKVPEDKK